MLKDNIIVLATGVTYDGFVDNIPIIVSLISIIISIITAIITIKESRRNELILKPRFSLEKNEDVDNNGLFIWKISNLGGGISNATIYPIMCVSFSFYNKQGKCIEITLQISDYYCDNYFYRNSDGSFYIKDDKQSKLDDFIETYINLINSDGFEDGGYRIESYFTLHFSDYRNKNYNKIYTIIDDELFIYDSKNKIFGDTMKQLKEVLYVPNVDIIVALEDDVLSVVRVNYKNAETQCVINNKQEYHHYLHSVILDLIDSKNKSIDKMLGDAILADGTLWTRDSDTGELIWVEDNVKICSFTEKSLKLCWTKENGESYIIE